MSEHVNDLLSLVGNDLSLRWMITLAHFLWQGTLIALAAAIFARVFQNASASLRYAIYAAALFGFPACVIGTFAMVDVPDVLRKPSLAVVRVDIPSIPILEQDSGLIADPPAANTSLTPSPSLTEPTIENLVANNPVPMIPQQSIASQRFPRINLMWLAPWISAAYLCGVVLFLMRLGRALWGGHRLRCISQPLSDSAVIQCMREQANRIGLRVIPVVGYCERVAVPTVVGVLRPMILLPASIMTGLTSQELSAVLSHELAHIRRYDLWMNLMQRLIESLLFFHPAVWFISRRLGAEREICCDDLVVQSGHTPMNYAGALLRMAELCVAVNKSQLATLAAAGHSPSELERRIERLMDIRHQATLRLTRAGVMLVIGSMLTCVATPAMLVALAQSDTREQAKSDEVLQSVPTDFDLATGRNIRWRVPLGSVTMRAPLIHDDHIYVGTNNDHAYNSRYPTSVDLGVLLCFQKSNGKILWQHSNEKLPTGRAHDWPMQGVTSRPYVEGDRLWYITNRCELVCLDTQGFHDSENDGFVKDEQLAEANEADVVWRYDMMDELGVRPHNISTCTVAVWKDRVFAVTGNGVDESHQAGVADAPSFIAVDKQTGKLLWSDDSPGQNVLHGQWGSPLIAEIAGKTQVIFPGGDGWIYSFDPLGTGDGKSKLIWKFDCNPKESVWILGGGFNGGSRGARNNLLHAPTVDQGLLYIAMGDDPEHGSGPGRVWCIDPSGTGDVSPELVFNKSDPDTPIPHRRVQACIVENGDFTRPNPNSKAVWQFAGQDVDGNGELSIEETMSRSLSTISIKDDLLFVSDIDGILHCLDRRTGLQHWGFDLFANLYSTPIIAGQYVYLGNENGDFSVFGCSSDPKVAFPNGVPVRQINFNNSINASTVIDENVIYVATGKELIAIGETQVAAQKTERSESSSDDDDAKSDQQEASNSDVSEPPEPEASEKEQTERNSLLADETTRVEGIVLNPDNKPIPGAPIAFLAFDDDEEKAFKPFYLHADNVGRFSADIPSRKLRVHIGSPNTDYESLREFHVRDGIAAASWDGLKAKSSDEKISVVATLPRTYKMQFDVVDADSGAPVKNVIVLYKEDEATWYESEQSHYETDTPWLPFQIIEEGKPTFQAPTPLIMNNAHVIIAAKGFEPVKLKLNERLERGRLVVKQVRMKATAPVEFILTTATGAPAIGATLETLMSKELRAISNYNGGTQLDQILTIKVKSDAQGVVRFPWPAFSNWTTYRIEHRSGYVNVRGKDLPQAAGEKSAVARKIQLITYASIQGKYLPQIKENEFLEMYRMKSNRVSVDGPAQQIVFKQGNLFEVANLWAGWYSFVHRVRSSEGGTTAIATYGPFELTGGEVHKLTLGNDGRSVVGRFVLPENLKRDARVLSVLVSSSEWTEYPQVPSGLDSAATLAWWNAFWSSDEGQRYHHNRCYFTTNSTTDGSFYFPSLPPGKYKLFLNELQPGGTHTRLMQTEFEVPDDTDSTRRPVDLGDLSTANQSINFKPQDQKAVGNSDTKKQPQQTRVQPKPIILGQWDVLPTPGNTAVAESMTLKFSEPDKFDRYVQKQDQVEFSTGSWKLEGDEVKVKFQSFAMQPTDQAKGEATLEIVAPDTLLLDGTRFRKRSSATPVTLAASHPLHDVAKEVLAKLNANSPGEIWQIVQLSDKPTVIAPQVVDNFDASKAAGYRLLLARDYREFGNLMQQAVMLPTDQPFRWRTEQIEIVLFADQPSKAPIAFKSRLVWLPANSRWPTYDMCLGDGLGYRWFVRAPMQVGNSLKYELQLTGGDDMLDALVQSAISIKNMPPAADCQIASALLSAHGERAVAAVEQAVRRKKPQEDLSRLIGCLSGIRTDSSTKLLIQLYQSDDGDIRRAAAYSLINKPYREEASQVYLDLLKNRMSVEATSAACIELGLKDAIPILKELFLNSTKPSSLRELNTIFAARRTLEGNPIPKSLLEASEVIYQSRPSDPTDEGSVIGNAVKQFMECKDHEAVIMLALQMVNYTTKGSFEHIRAINAQGTAILKSQKSAEAVFFATRVLDSLEQREREQILQTMNPLVQSNSVVTPTPQPSSYLPDSNTTLPATKPVPTGPRKLVATIFGTTVFLDQLEPVESSKAELRKLPQDQAAAKRLDIQGEALLSMIARRAVEDYVRREQIEITPEMSSKLFEVVKTKELSANPDSTMSDDKRRAGLLFMMRASLMDWLVCKSLYEKYGGRVGMGSLGLWIAVDGRNELMREYLKKGSIVISDAELETAFWKAANKPNFADAYPKGEELKRLMATPPFFGDRQ